MEGPSKSDDHFRNRFEWNRSVAFLNKHTEGMINTVIDRESLGFLEDSQIDGILVSFKFFEETLWVSSS